MQIKLSAKAKGGVGRMENKKAKCSICEKVKPCFGLKSHDDIFLCNQCIANIYNMTKRDEQKMLDEYIKNNPDFTYADLRKATKQYHANLEKEDQRRLQRFKELGIG